MSAAKPELCLFGKRKKNWILKIEISISAFKIDNNVINDSILTGLDLTVTIMIEVKAVCDQLHEMPLHVQLSTIACWHK